MILDLQKASMWKRISAFLLDAILLIVLATGLFCLIAWVTGYDQYQQTVDAAYERVAEQYGITPEMAYKTAETLTEAETEAILAANAAIAADTEAVYAYQMVASLSLLIITFGLLGAFLVLEFAVPLFLANGQTVGKKIFGLGVMHTEFVRIRPVALFIRTVLGKFAVGAMPLAMAALFVISGMGSAVFLLIALILLAAQIITLVVSHENAALHDKMAVTAVVDLGSQMIFDTHEQMLAYKKKLAAEKAASSVY